MLDHLLIYAPSDRMQQTVAFYEAALAPIGYKRAVDFGQGRVVGFSDGTGHPQFWISSTEGSAAGRAHFAFRAKGWWSTISLLASIDAGHAKSAREADEGFSERHLVDECYAKGLAAGGKDNGQPGPRAMYGPTYYAGFIDDPAGNGTEIVYRED